jgi:subtilase family serine protease
MLKNTGTVAEAVLDVEFIAGGKFAGKAFGGDLIPGDEKTSYITATLSKGNHSLQIKVDPDNKASEGDESNDTTPAKTVACTWAPPRRGIRGLTQINSGQTAGMSMTHTRLTGKV